MYNPKLLEQKVQELLTKSDSAHDFQHAKRVWSLVQQIMEGEGVAVDRDALHAACFLHDVGYLFLKDKRITDDHPLLSAEFSKRILPEVDFPKEKMALVAEVITWHDASKAWWTGADGPALKEAWYLQDADTLEVTGALGVARIITYGAVTGRPLCFALGDERPGSGGVANTADDLARQVEAFNKKWRTETARKIAEPKIAFMREFVERMVREFEGKTT